MDIILYIDCDGVIFNTIETAFLIMKQNNIDISDNRKVDYFFRNTSWDLLLEKSIIINDAVNKIKLLKEKQIYKDVVILTKLSGNYNEERLKRDTFKLLLPEIKVITLQRDYDKALVVPSYGNILIDDEEKNVISWNKNGGFGIRFISNISDFENDIINNLDDIENTKKMKLLRKTRYY